MPCSLAFLPTPRGVPYLQAPHLGTALHYLQHITETRFISLTGKIIFSSNVGLEEFFVVVEISLTQIEEIKSEAKCLINTLALRVP